MHKVCGQPIDDRVHFGGVFIPSAATISEAVIERASIYAWVAMVGESENQGMSVVADMGEPISVCMILGALEADLTLIYRTPWYGMPFFGPRIARSGLWSVLNGRLYRC